MGYRKIEYIEKVIERALDEWSHEYCGVRSRPEHKLIANKIATTLQVERCIASTRPISMSGVGYSGLARVYSDGVDWIIVESIDQIKEYTLENYGEFDRDDWEEVKPGKSLTVWHDSPGENEWTMPAAVWVFLNKEKLPCMLASTEY